MATKKPKIMDDMQILEEYNKIFDEYNAKKLSKKDMISSCVYLHDRISLTFLKTKNTTENTTEKKGKIE